MIKTIGFIGQGWLGKHYADWYEQNGFPIVRYGLEPAYAANKEKIAGCDLVYIAVPTPTTPDHGFDAGILQSVIRLVGTGKTALIKSTVIPGTTRKLQEAYPDRRVIFSPEILTEATAAYDVAHPSRTIIGYTDEKDLGLCKEILAVMPEAPYTAIVRAEEAELIKYGGNCWFYFKVLFMNTLYDMAQKQGLDYSKIQEALAADPRIGATHLDPVHHSGRGAGGHCFIKDFEAYRREYLKLFPEDTVTREFLNAAVRKNLQLLSDSGKDDQLVREVYGDSKQLPPSA